MKPSPDRHQKQHPIVPLDAPIRTTPIHPLLPDIRVPGQTPSDPPPSTRDGDGDRDGNTDRDSHKDALKTYSYNPATCLPLQIHHHRRHRRRHGPSSQPNDDDDDSGQDSEYDNDNDNDEEQYGNDASAELRSLRKTHPTRDGALQAQTQAALDAAQRIADLRRRREEVQRAMDKKVKERNTEMKVLEKYQEVKVRASDILPS